MLVGNSETALMTASRVHALFLEALIREDVEQKVSINAQDASI